MKHLTFGFVGLGLIGGSIARALKIWDSECTIVAYNRSKEPVRHAISDKVVDIEAPEVDESFERCDYIFLCTPVEKNNEFVKAIKEFMNPTAILTDVGSVKGPIMDVIYENKLQANFIGGHPMAGSERVGYDNSKARILENAYYVLAPTPEVDSKKLEEFKDIITNLKSIPIILDAKEHDYIVGGISHLPHLIAASLVELVKESDNDSNTMKRVAAGGFKDITRIASSSPDMWEQILDTNADNVASLLEDYINKLTSLKAKIENHESLYDFFKDARDYRDSFASQSSGPIKSEYSITVDIADRPGSIAPIASILALTEINIKNIGITHNREAAEGALSISFYEEEDIEKALDVLSRYGYTVKKRNL